MNNMGKGFGVVIAGIVISAVGAVIAGVSAKKAIDDYKSYDKYKDPGHVVLNSTSKLHIEGDAGVINIHHSTTSESYVDYHVLEIYEVKIDQEEGEIKLKRKWQYWFVWSINNKSTVDVYLTDNAYDAYLEVNAGQMNLDSGFTFNSLTIDVSAGQFKCSGDTEVTNDALFRISAGDINIDGNFKVGKKATLKASAGDLDLNYVEAKEVETRISAGDIKCKVKSDDIKFNVSAGDLVMDIVGDEDDYKISVKKSAGSCNLSNKDSGSKSIDGKISAGKATINFVD